MGLFDLSDEQRYGLLMAAAQMMQPGAGGTSGAVGRGLMSGLQGYQGALALKDRRAEEAQQRESRGLLMDQQKQQMADSNNIRSIFQRNNMPGNLTPGDDEGNAMPAAPQGFNMQGLQQGLMGAGPAGLPYLAQMSALMAKEGPMKVGKDDRLVDRNTFKEVLPAAPNLPSGMTMGANGPEYMPAYLKGQQDIRAAGRPQVSVNTNLPPLERKEQQDMGALHVKNYGDMQAAAGTARKENSLLSALAKNPVQTGAATPLTATAAAWLSAAGLGGDQVKQLATDAQQFNAVAKDLVLQKQLAQKGPQTESDARRLEQTVANLGNTPDSNAAIIAFSLAQNNRTIEQERFYNSWWQKKGTLRGADEAWIGGPGAKSLWDDPSLKRFAAKPDQGGSPSVEEIDAEIRRRMAR